jgi:imidazolonepropionase-like amidohydrolase
MITINGARSMLRDNETGSLEEQEKADLRVLDLIRETCS